MEKKLCECPYCHKLIDCDLKNNSEEKEEIDDMIITRSGDNTFNDLSLEDWENSNFY